MAQRAEHAKDPATKFPFSGPQAKAQTQSMALMSPWEIVKILTVYIGNTEEAVKGNISRRRLVASEFLFVVQATVQVILTIVLTVLGIVQNEFDDCLELAIPNLLWLVRTALACYLLLWAHWMQRAWRSRILASAASSGRHAQPLTGPEVAAILPCSRASMLLHIRLTVVLSVTTAVLYAATGTIWIFRQSHCDWRAPLIHKLSSIIYITATLSYFAYFTALWVPSIKKQLCKLGNDSAAADKPLSQSEVDRLPLVLYRPSGLGGDSASGLASALPGFVPAQVPLNDGRSTKKRRSTLLSFFHRSQPISLPQNPDIEAGSDETPLLDRVNTPPFTPLLPHDSGDCSVCLGSFSSRPLAGTGNNHVAGTESAGESSPHLRLLPCGHAHHKECIDKWLTQKSSRCPYCQEAVDLSHLTDDGDRMATDFLDEYMRVVGLRKGE